MKRHPVSGFWMAVSIPVVALTASPVLALVAFLASFVYFGAMLR